MALSSSIADAAIQAAKSKAAEMGVAVSIAVVDDGGYLVSFARMDGGRWVNVDIAIAKAAGAAAFKVDSNVMVGVFEHIPMFFEQMIATTKGRIILDHGSVVIRDGAGQVIGALAISGATGEQDEVIARAALEAIA